MDRRQNLLKTKNLSDLPPGWHSDGGGAAVSEAICSKPLINISHSSSGRNDLARIY